MGSVVESHWVAATVSDRLLGSFVVVAAYLPLAWRGAGKVTYGEYWAGMLESARRLQLRFGIEGERMVLLGDMNAHLGSLPGGRLSECVLQARRLEGY